MAQKGYYAERAEKKSKGTSKRKEQTEYQRARDAAKKRKKKCGKYDE